MGYFDALTSSCFKTAHDGRKLFFPWGVLGRGYVIPSNADYERLRGQLKIYTIVSLLLIIAAAAFRNYLAAFGIAAILILFYFGWARYLMRGLQPSEERMSLNESMATQAVHHGAIGLWVLEIISLLFVAIGLFMFFTDPSGHLLALGSIIFFGFCAVVLMRMIMLRRRSHPAGG
jgi:hypothetical protein